MINLLQTYDERERESKLLNWMRFPMVVGVVFVHNPNPGVSLCNLNELTLGNVLSNIWFKTSGHLLCDLCVPLFFILAGYFYFYNIDHFNKDVFYEKTRKRVKSLLIPYLIWCVMPIVWPIFRKIVGMIIHHHGPKQLLALIYNSNWTFQTLFWDDGSGMPFNFPLWFLRDLMFICLLTPLIHYVITKANLKGVGVTIIICLCLGQMPVTILNFFSCMPYFIIGAYISIKRLSPFKLAHVLLPISFVGLLLVPFYLYFDSVWIGKIIIPLLLPLAIYIPNVLFTKEVRGYSILDRSVFFIYVAHGQMCLYLVHRWMSGIMPANAWGGALIYLFVPIMTVCILVIVCNLLCRLFPQTMSIVLGRDVVLKDSKC